MKAFHSDPAIKEKYLDRVRIHRAADELVKGTYWQNGKGCAIGCTIHSGEHADYETKLGIPIVLARLEDALFEGLPNELAMTWPERFLDAITPSADLSKVWNKFAIWLLIDVDHGVIKYAEKQTTIDSINAVANLYIRSLKEDVPRGEWHDAADAAADVDAYTAAHAAAYAADAYGDAAATAAGDAAYAATAYAAAAAYGDAYAADAAARKKFWVKSSEELIRLLEECK